MWNQGREKMKELVSRGEEGTFHTQPITSI